MQSTRPTGAPYHNTPCVVIVDTRNVRGMLSDFFGGTAFKPTAGGIRRALDAYGFKVRSIYAGIATGTTNNKPSDKVTDMVQRNIRYRDDLNRHGVHVLEGYLAERDGNIEEKKVDVLLALQIAAVVEQINSGNSDAKCIVSVSEDMDLMPAYDYAHQRGVPVYALSNQTIHRREDQRKWLILHEDAARLLAETQDTDGTPLRAYAARLAVGQTQRTLPSKWRARWEQRPGNVTLFNNKGLKGSYYSIVALPYGEPVDLCPTGIVFPEGGVLFPEVTLDKQGAGVGPMGDVREAHVRAWVAPTEVKAKFADGSGCGLTVPPGSVLEGDRIAVFSTRRKTGVGHYYIGPLDRLVLPATWPHDSAITTATITSTKPGSNLWEAVLTDGTTTVLVHPGDWLRHAQVGDTLLVALAAHDASAGEFRTMPLSCCLPAR